MQVTMEDDMCPTLQRNRRLALLVRHPVKRMMSKRKINGAILFGCVGDSWVAEPQESLLLVSKRKESTSGTSNSDLCTPYINDLLPPQAVGEDRGKGA